MFERLPVMLWVTTAPGLDIAFVNRRAEEYTGIRKQEMSTVGIASFVHPDDIAAVRAAAIQAFGRDADTWDVPFRIRTADGHFHLTLGRAACQRDQKGRILWWYIANSDLEQLLTDKLLLGTASRCNVGSCSEARFFKANIMPMYFLQRRGDVDNLSQWVQVDSNDAKLDLIGYSREELDAGVITSATTTPTESWPEQIRKLRVALETGGAPPTEEHIVRKDRTRRDVMRGMAWHSATDSFLVVEMDVTERKLAEKAGSEAKTFFLANVSHEIRTPLNGIVAMAELLRDLVPSGEALDFVDTISRSSQVLLSLINELLDFSRIESGKMELRLAEFDVVPLVEEVIDLLGPLANAKHLELLYHVDPRVPAWLHGDPGRLRQILVNLAGNGIKFCDRGHVEIRLTPVDSQLQPPARDTPLTRHDAAASTVAAPESNVFRLCVEVSDSGVGIAPEDQVRLFQPFSQVDKSAVRRSQGTGLGLLISRKLVEAMGGDIGVRSRPGQGSTFWCRISLGQPEPRPPLIGDLQRLPDKRLLVVDQSEAFRHVVGEWLSDDGAAFDVASSSVEASERIRRAPLPYDAMLLSAVDGTADVLAALRDTDQARGTRLLLVSTGHPDAVRCDPLVGGTLLKPLRLWKLRDVLLNPKAAEEPTPSLDLPSGPAPTRRWCVLVVEDNEVNQKVAVRQLDKLNCDSLVAENGLRALEILETPPRQIDAILMDSQMPVMDGFEATREIRRREQTTGRHVPVIAMTANVWTGAAEHCLSAGMDAYISKPVTIVAIRDALAKFFCHAELPAPGAADSAADSDPDRGRYAC